jgi:glucose/arabinose dehydrogenase
MRRLLALFATCLLFLPLAAAAQTHPTGFNDYPLVSGLTEPTTLLAMPGGKLLVGQRGGVIRVIDQGLLLPKPMLTIAVETYEEQGLLGMALDPQFPATPWIYIFYTPFTGAQPAPASRVSRFTIQADTIVAGSEVVVLGSIPTGLGWHQAGCVRTSADGHLWVSIGEGGNGGTFGWPRQITRLEGKLLRLNLDGSIPANNPFVGVAGARGEIWQLGLRNPFRFTIQPVTGQPFVNDVGSAYWEEVDVGPPGADFGWANYEGTVLPQPAGVTNPLYTYPHAGSGACITAGVFYTGAQFPAEYQGNYLFLEHSRGQIGRMVLNGSNQLVSITMPWATSESEGWGYGPVDMIQGDDGSLYYTQYEGGQVRRLMYGSLTDVEPGAQRQALSSPWPNPARGESTLRLTLAGPGRARLAIHDAQGRHVRTLLDADLPAGPHSASWDGTDDRGRAVPPGLYLALLEAEGRTHARRIVRLD